jgi:hypothetical protein
MKGDLRDIYLSKDTDFYIYKLVDQNYFQIL